MLKNFFKITIRNLWRNKGYSSINIFGLAIGMAAAMLILLWVHNEVSFDRYHVKGDRIYLLHSRDIAEGRTQVWDKTTEMMSPVLKQDYAEVEDAIRYRIVYFLMTASEKHLNVQGAFADSGFLSVFTYPLLKGNPENALSDNHSIVLTRKLAEKLFGNEDAMGKTVRIDSADHFTVTGVLKDLPGNTNFDFEYLLPWTYLTKLGWNANETWTNADVRTYVLLKQGASPEAFNTKIKDIVSRHTKADGTSVREVITQPLSRVYLYSKPENGQLVGGRIATVKLFTTIAIFILLIACINFMNLSTARSEKRAKEVGIRKVVGARKGSLIAQFIGESILLTSVAFVIALCLVQVSLDGFDQIVGSQLRIDPANPNFWLFAVLFILFTGVVAGSYPAFYLSASKPVKVLKGAFKHVHALITPRKVLVVLQFTFAIVLIISTIIVRQQIRYAQDRDTGYKRDHLVYNFTQGDINEHYDLIKHDLLSGGAAIAVTKTSAPITRNMNFTSGFTWPGSTAADKNILFMQWGVGADFVSTTGTQLIQGRDIDLKNYPTDSTAMLLNEAAVKAMHLTDPVGKQVTRTDGIVLHVVGVLKDFIIESPYEDIGPLAVFSQPGGFGVVNFRLNPANPVADNLAKAEKVFKQYNPQYPFEYYFVDEYYARKFADEQREGKLSAIFAGLTILISCLGLFGLAAYMAESRIKEIGVRKVLGASVTGITTLLSKDFIKLVFIAILIASPLAWLAMEKWLGSFPYRIQISWVIFLASGLLAIVIALLTVSYQAIKAAIANPVDSLRSE